MSGGAGASRPGGPPAVPVTVAICTRDRGDAIVATIASVLAGDHADFELLIVDQSASAATRDAIAANFDDPRIEYHRADDVGLSRARNRVLRAARGEFVLMTDDDCVVRPNWIGANLDALAGVERPSLVFADVVPVDDPDGGFTPESVATGDAVVRSVSGWRPSSDGVNIGIGASMAFRRSDVVAAGGFDELLGPGAEFENADDTDMALRLLLAGRPIRRITTTGVDHAGARPPEEFRQLARGAAFGLGATAGKLMRWKPAPMAWFVAMLYWRLVGSDLVRSVVRLRKPPVLGRAVHLTRGLASGLRHPVDPSTHRFIVRRPAVAFITERHVGLRTFSENLERFVVEDDRIDSSWHPVEYTFGSTLADRLPALPESLRGALRGRAEVRRAIRRAGADAHLFLTQTPLALGGRLARRRPYVVVTDDTPRLFDTMAERYGKGGASGGLVGGLKHHVYVRGLRGAHRVIPMSLWARTSLIDDYGVDEGRIEVIPTGLDLDEWRPGEPNTSSVPRILFVGGDFDRKGGHDLLAALDLLTEPAELDVVTRSSIEPRPAMRVRRGLEPNSDELRRLYRSCDVLVLPSRAETFGNVLVEAAAAGLPAVVTDVGAMSEIVIDGVTGYVIDPGDVAALARRLDDLLGDPSRRAEMGRAARRSAEANFDGRVNARRVVDALLGAVSARS